MSTEEPRYFMIRAMRQTDADFDVFFKKSVVAVGWSKVRFSDYDDAAELARKVEATYYADGTTVASQVGRKKSEVIRFKGMETGDRIIVPHYNKVRFASVIDGTIYDDECSSDETDLGNQRAVAYLHKDSAPYEVYRRELSEGLQRRLSVRGSTVTDLSEFSNELSKYWTDERQTESAWDSELETARLAAEIQFKTRLLQDIQDGRTKLHAQGRGLEHLVKELLELDGFTAEVLSKQRFKHPADADVLASRSDRIMGAQRILVQVKHHRGRTDEWGARQLAEIRKNHLEYDDCVLIMVTSGESSPSLEAMCEKEEITLITGSDLVTWIMEVLPKLDKKTKEKLGILEVSRLKSETSK